MLATARALNLDMDVVTDTSATVLQTDSPISPSLPCR